MAFEHFIFKQPVNLMVWQLLTYSAVVESDKSKCKQDALHTVPFSQLAMMQAQAALV